MVFSFTTRVRRAPIVLTSCAVIALASAIAPGWAGRGPGNDSNTAAAATIPLEIANIYIEFNATDNDLGFHVLLDGEDWKEMKILKPDGRSIFEVRGRGGYGLLGMTELFFEGAEPSLDEVPLEELLALFPEGSYQFIGKTVDGEALEGVGILTHMVPAAPVVLSPEDGAVVNPNNFVISWEAVTEPPGIQVASYEVIVGGSSFRLPASQTSLKVPPEILEPGREYEFEVLAKEVGGNQTITAGSFETQ